MGIDEVIAEFGPALARVAASYERDAGLREDLVQEIVLAIFRALPRLEDPAKLRPFVFRIAHNRCVSHVVRQVGRPAEDEGALQRLVSGEAGPEEALLAEERSRRLVEAVRALPLPYRQVTTLLLEDLSHAEIAEALGLTLTNVGVRISRAKTQLRRLLGHE